MPPLMALGVDIGRKFDIMNRLMTLLEIAFSLGMVLGPIMAGIAAEAFDLRIVFWMGGVIGITTSIRSLFTLLKLEKPS